MSCKLRKLRLGVVGIVLVALLVPCIAQAAPEGFTWGSFSPRGVTAFGVYAGDNTTILKTGDRVQLIYAGPDGKIDLPNCSGEPGNDDEVLQSSIVQNRGSFPKAAHNRGYVPFSIFTFDSGDPRSGGAVYLRAWSTVARVKAPAEQSGVRGQAPQGQAEGQKREATRIVWGDSGTSRLRAGMTLNAARWSANRTCDPAQSKVALLKVPGLGAYSAQESRETRSSLSAVGASAVPDRADATESSWHLLALPLLPSDTTLDGVLGQQLTGTGDPTTADRVLVWNGATQSYGSAWFCGGQECADLGAPEIVNHWLDNLYNFSTLQLPPDAGFWVENRSGAAETVSIVGDVADADRSVPVGSGWQLLGSAIPLARGLDQMSFPATGSDGPLTADRVLYWDAAARAYQSAWFCGGQACVDLGAPEIVNHWLDNLYNPTTIVIEPGHGFWYQNRHAPFTWINPL